MPSVYLEAGDYVTYGVPNATAQQVIQASAIIDGWLNRPDGLIFTLDENNQPNAMAATGLPIMVREIVPGKCQITLTNAPVVALIDVQYNSTPGIPPQWVTVTNSKFASDGQVWLDQSVPPRTSVMIQYVAGWLYSNLPSVIKQVCANIVSLLGDGITSGGIGGIRAGDTEIKFNTNGKTNNNIYIDASNAAMLAPYQRVTY